MKETPNEYTEDSLLGLAFLVLCLAAAWRLLVALPSLNLYFERSGGGRVIAAFYFLIFISCLLRAIWFLIPSDILEGSYVPVAKEAFVSRNWVGILVSEVLLALGSLGVYSIFILIASFWAHMLQSVDSVDEMGLGALPIDQQSQMDDDSSLKKGPLFNFSIMMSVIVFSQLVNFVLFLSRIYDSDAMILYDSIVFAILSLATFMEFKIFSNRIQHVLATIQAINANNTSIQQKVIAQITWVASGFFIIHFILEATLASDLIFVKYHGKTWNHIFRDEQLWEVYINIKHWSEVLVLAFSLMISLPGQSSSRLSIRAFQRGYERIPEPSDRI